MTLKKIVVFAVFVVLFGALYFAVRAFDRTLEPHLPRMLDVASQRGQVRRMRLLIFLGADVNSKVCSDSVCGNATEKDVEMDYHTALQSAALGGQAESIELLLGRGANINATDGFGRTALWYVALGGNTEATRLLLEKGADPRISSKRFSMDSSPLEEAARNGHTEIINMLLERGAGQNGQLDSALWEAVWWGKPRTAKFLISKGASVSQFRDGMTLLSASYEHGDAEFIEYLKQAGAK